MKNLKYLVMNLALMGAASVAMTGCPGVTETTCETAEDCADGEICNADGACEVEADTTCVEDADCTTEGERCLPTADDATVSECRAPENCSEQEDPTAFCVGELGEGATCDTTVPEAIACAAGGPTSERRYVQILDSSTGASSCDSVSPAGSTNADPGSDIMYAQLLNEGEVIGYAKGVEFSPGTNDNANDNAFVSWDTVFTGDAPGLGDDDCPVENPAGSGNKFRADSVVSLGCSGFLVVEFADVNDITNILTLSESQQVDVGEFGPYCTNPNGSEGSDQYGVYLCETEVGADPSTIDFDTECLIELGVEAQGQTLFDVPAPDAAE